MTVPIILRLLALNSCTYVGAPVRSFEADAADRLVGDAAGFLDGFAGGDNIEDAPAAALEVAFFGERGAGMEDVHAGLVSRQVEGNAAGGLARIARGAHHDARRSTIAPLGLDVCEPALACSQQQLEQVGPEQGHD